jgi:hypothetical protein
MAKIISKIDQKFTVKLLVFFRIRSDINPNTCQRVNLYGDVHSASPSYVHFTHCVCEFINKGAALCNGHATNL